MMTASFRRRAETSAGVCGARPDTAVIGAGESGLAMVWASGLETGEGEVEGG
jgi:hypothetical protein